MPRTARKKTYDSIFHVMCKSISEVDLFMTDADRVKYMELLKWYQNIHMFRIYGYCLMSNHVHLIVDANGADISTIMHCVNFRYALYFNGEHKRHGHLFQDRFKSKIVMDDDYLYALSAYIHNNPTDIAKYKGNPEKYPFSSLGVYFGMHKDPYELIEDSFVLRMFGNNPITARQKYRDFMGKCSELLRKEDFEFVGDQTEYRSERTILSRDKTPMDIVDYIIEKTQTSKLMIHTKYVRSMVEIKAILAVALRSFCNAKCSDICKILGNITQSRVSGYCSIGVGLIKNDVHYREILGGLIKI